VRPTRRESSSSRRRTRPHSPTSRDSHAEGSAPLSVEPFLDDRERGLFATRAPRRPNPIGLSVVAIETVRDAEVVVRGVDVVDGTPVLDVKPFVPAFDVPASTSGGWVAASSNSPESTRSDDRFV
jgi:tRNA (Thr-GGU) A37 N-methylase